MVKPTKDPKQGKTGGKDGKAAAGGGAQGPAAGGGADADKGQAAAAEVMPVEAPPAVGTGCKLFIHQLINTNFGWFDWDGIPFCILICLKKENLNVSRWILTGSRSLCFLGHFLKPPWLTERLETSPSPLSSPWVRFRLSLFSLPLILVALPWKVREDLCNNHGVPAACFQPTDVSLLIPPSGNYGDIFEPAAQTSSGSSSPATRSRKMMAGSPEGRSKLYSPPSPLSIGSTSPLLPRDAQETSSTSRSTTQPLKPNIVEGNRLSHVAAWSDVHQLIRLGQIWALFCICVHF